MKKILSHAFVCALLFAGVSAHQALSAAAPAPTDSGPAPTEAAARAAAARRHGACECNHWRSLLLQRH